MRLNRDILITAIVKHQNTFFKVLDYIDNNDNSLEFPEHLYINLYNEEICSDQDNHIPVFLSIASLIENGIFIHNDKNSGMITIERIVVDLLRFLDIKRIKELTHFDFEQFRIQICNITEQLQKLPPSTQDYHDASMTFNRLMSEIHSTVKENIAGLTAQVESLAKDYNLYDSGASNIDIFDLYNKVNTLYSRFVMPCYDFINPEMQMKGTQSFSQAIDNLIHYYAQPDLAQYKMSNAIQFRKTAITSYYKNISVLVRKLEQFSSHLERERSYFLAIEGVFSELMDSITLLRHGRQRNKYLTADSSIFQELSVLDGLREHKAKYSSKLTYQKENIKLRFKEYLLGINETNIKTKNTKLTPIPPNASINIERHVIISQLLYNIPIPSSIKNVHKYIYNFLEKNLDNFTLIDLLFGLESFFSMFEKENLIFTYSKQQLTDNYHFLNYLTIELKRSE